MTDATMNRWQSYEFSSGAYPGEDYISFQKAMRADLNKQLKSVGLVLKQFNKGHYYFSAVVTDGEKFVYISISDVRGNNKIFKEVLYRTMAHEKDWTGGNNQYCHWNDIGTACKKLLEQQTRKD